MADDARITPPDLSLVPQKLLPGVGFFQLLRSLETDVSQFGRGNSPKREPARICQSMRLSFATQDNASFVAGTADLPAKVETMTIGLMGPDAPMPLHLTRWVLDRLSNRWFAGDAEGITSDTTFVDFCNLLQHRTISLYYRAWADTRPEVQIERGEKTRIMAMLKAVAGIAPESDKDFNDIKLRQAASLAQQVRSPERLAVFLSEVVSAPVQINEFIGHWMDVAPNLQSRLGRVHSVLGQSAVVGNRSYQRSDCAEIRVGPVDRETFDAFMLGTEKTEALRRALLFAAGQDVAFDLRIVLEKSQIPEAKLGEARLSTSSWLAPTRDKDAESACTRGIVGAPATLEDAA